MGKDLPVRSNYNFDMWPFAYSPWTQEQDNLLREWRSRNIPLKTISREIEQKFGSYRTVQALQGRLGIMRKQHPEDNINLQHSNSWPKEQIDWLRIEAYGKRKINWKDLGVQFKAKFGLSGVTAP